MESAHAHARMERQPRRSLRRRCCCSGRDSRGRASCCAQVDSRSARRHAHRDTGGSRAEALPRHPSLRARDAKGGSVIARRYAHRDNNHARHQAARRRRPACAAVSAASWDLSTTSPRGGLTSSMRRRRMRAARRSRPLKTRLTPMTTRLSKPRVTLKPRPRRNLPTCSTKWQALRRPLERMSTPETDVRAPAAPSRHRGDTSGAEPVGRRGPGTSRHRVRGRRRRAEVRSRRRAGNSVCLRR